MHDSVIAITAALAITCASSAAAWSQTAPPPGATACSGCHGGSDSAMPSLQGKSASDIEAAMTAFRTGGREATVMDRIAKGFTKRETNAIADWLAQAGAAK
ncbi:MAG: cytochrome C [Beijerinckiaceae bacterium]|nr:cytochrome C [Beijerinckiaceae bacterium]